METETIFKYLCAAISQEKWMGAKVLFDLYLDEADYLPEYFDSLQDQIEEGIKHMLGE